MQKASEGALMTLRLAEKKAKGKELFRFRGRKKCRVQEGNKLLFELKSVKLCCKGCLVCLNSVQKV